MPRVLVTAFEPFGGDSINASLEAVRSLPARIDALEITTAVLPTSFSSSLAALERAIASAQPEIVLCVGQAADRASLCVERVAINVQDARLPDNDGAMPSDVPVVVDGPPAYFSTLPVKAVAAALLAQGLSAVVSNSAGSFVCNHVFYGLMHHAATHGRQFRGGLLHVPRLLEYASASSASEPGAVGMALDDIKRGIVIVLKAVTDIANSG